MRYFDTDDEAFIQQHRDDRYFQDEIELSLEDIEALKNGKILYHDFDDKSCILKLRK